MLARMGWGAFSTLSRQTTVAHGCRAIRRSFARVSCRVGIFSEPLDGTSRKLAHYWHTTTKGEQSATGPLAPYLVAEYQLPLVGTAGFEPATP